MKNERLREALLRWYRKHGRKLPWRMGKTRWGRDPYRVLVSEVMLQQTQVERAIPFYKRWITRWPTVGSLARARRSAVINAWVGLGYNRRSVYLHEAAKTIVYEYDGRFPRSEVKLMELPGVGAYTARAILAFAYGKDLGVLDTNTRRVLLRVFFGVSRSRDDEGVPERKLVELADSVVGKGMGDAWNQAMMDFGALVCTARNPKCSKCPMQELCLWFQSGRTAIRIRKKNAVRFEETDRYFRGRIVDLVRAKALTTSALYQVLKRRHGLDDRGRFLALIQGLVRDGLIVVSGKRVGLP